MVTKSTICNGDVPACYTTQQGRKSEITFQLHFLLTVIREKFITLLSPVMNTR